MEPLTGDTPPKVNGVSWTKSEDQPQAIRGKKVKTPVVVDIQIKFLRIAHIDTTKDVFSGKVEVVSSWPEPKLDSYSEEDLEDYDHKSENYWNPRIVIENIHGSDSKEPSSYKVKREHGYTKVYETQKIKANFYESMELAQFPCDTQDISIKCVSLADNVEINDVSDVDKSRKLSAQFTEGSHKKTKDSKFLDGQHWHLCEDVTSEKVEAVGESQAGIIHTAQVIRKCGYFIWNFVLIMMLITTLSFAPFCMEGYSGRFKLFFTLMLTQVAFKFSASNNLPKVSYLTYLDKYVISCMAFMFTMSIWNAVITTIASYQTEIRSWACGPTCTTNQLAIFKDEKFALPEPGTLDNKSWTNLIDTIAGGVFGILYILMQVYFFIVVNTQTKASIALKAETRRLGYVCCCIKA